MLTARRRLRGGVFLSDNESGTELCPIRPLAPPSRLAVPLVQWAEPPAVPRVGPDDPVAAGQVMATPAPSAPGGLAVHAPVSATVGALVKVDTPYRDGVPAIELHSTANQPPPPPDVAAELPRWSAAQLWSAIQAAGILLEDAPPAAEGDQLDWLIVNGLESEPGKTAQLRSLMDHTTDVLTTTSWLKQTLGARRACLVVDARRRRLPGRRSFPGGLAELRRAARALPVGVLGLPNKYPQSFTPLLVQSVTGREVPYLGSAREVGVWVVGVCTVLDIRRAALAALGQMGTVISVGGDAVARPGNYRIPLGVTVGDVARQVGAAGAATVLADNILSGPAVRHAKTVVTKRTQMLLFSTLDHRSLQAPTARRTLWAARTPPEVRMPMGCIRCGRCQDHCPVGIDPRALLDLVERGRFDRVGGRFPAACIDCGLCDYVCPSSLPLMRAVQRSRSHVLDI